MKRSFIITGVLCVALSWAFSSCDSSSYPGSGGGGSSSSSSGVLPGLFSVSETQKVQFSKGNLWYDATKGKWYFADEQYQIIGEGNNGNSRRDLFGWGTGNDPMKNSKDQNDYEVFHEWGGNSIANGKNANWRTLTQDEWDYLLRRIVDGTYGNNLRACVCGMNGYVIWPDGWKKTDEIQYNTNEFSFEDNPIALPMWRKMEAQGAVFLPCAGLVYNGDSDPDPKVSSIGEDGFYWTSTPRTYFSSYIVHASNSNINVSQNCGNYNRCSVRLVVDSNN